MPTANVTPGQLAESMDCAVQVPRHALSDSSLGPSATLDELADVWEKCRSPDWDGFSAMPVQQETLTAAYMLIDSLPLNFPQPAVGAEPDGQITLEWHRAPHRTLSVSIDRDGFLHYAGLYGANRQYGRIAYFSSVPKELLRLVRDL